MNEKEGRWSKIDRLELGGLQLSSNDECYYFLERSNGTYIESFANDVVNNFQKDLEEFGHRPEVMRHKKRAIRYFGSALYQLLSQGTPSMPWVIVPMVTSLPKSEKHHDDRLMLAAYYAASLSCNGILVDDILDTTEVLKKAKEGGTRDPAILETKITASQPKYSTANNIVLIDDVLTTGGHFVACKNIVSRVYPNSNIIGAFLSKHISKYEYEIDNDFGFGI